MPSYRSSSPLMLALLFGVALPLALPNAAAAKKSPACKRLYAQIKKLGVLERTAENPMTSGQKAERARIDATEIRAKVQTRLGTCNWVAILAAAPALRPMLGAAAGAEKGVLGKAMLALELRIRTLLPDDSLCHVANRGGKASRKASKCFNRQDKGADKANLKRFGVGWCKRLKIGRTSKNAGIEMNAIASMFESEGMPSELPAKVVAHWVQTFCPKMQ